MFEFDSGKSAANKVKHEIDFEEAQALWDDPAAYAIHVAQMPEDRWALIARIAGKHWCMIFARRNRNIRIISVRRARAKEIQAYEQGEADQR